MKKSELVFGHKDSNVTKRQLSYKILIQEVDKIDKYTLHDDTTVQKMAKDILRKKKSHFKRLLDDGNTKAMSDQEKLDQVVSMLKRRLRDDAEDPGTLIKESNISRYDVVIGRGGKARYRETNKLFERRLKALVNLFRDDYNQASSQEKKKIASDLLELVEVEMKEILGVRIRFIIRRKNKEGETEYYVASPSYMRSHFQKKLSEKRIKKQAKDDATFLVGLLEDQSNLFDTAAKQVAAEETKGDDIPLSELCSMQLLFSNPVPIPVEKSYWSEADIKQFYEMGIDQKMLHESFEEVYQDKSTSLEHFIGDFDEGTWA